MFCTQCGAEGRDGDRFCAQCGAGLRGQDAAGPVGQEGAGRFRPIAWRVGLVAATVGVMALTWFGVWQPVLIGASSTSLLGFLATATPLPTPSPTLTPVPTATPLPTPIPVYHAEPFGPVRIDAGRNYTHRLGAISQGMRVRAVISVAFNNRLSNLTGTPDIDVIIVGPTGMVKRWQGVRNNFPMDFEAPSDGEYLLVLDNSRATFTAKQVSIQFSHP